MHNKERYYAMLNDNRVVRPFGWGAEFVDADINSGDPAEFFRNYSAEMIASSDEYYHLPEVTDYEMSETQYESGNSQYAIRDSPGEEKKGAKSELRNAPSQVTWTSAIKTPSPENNTVYTHFFRTKRTKKPR